MTSHDAVFKLRKILQEEKLTWWYPWSDVAGVLPAVRHFVLNTWLKQEGLWGRNYHWLSTTTEDAGGEIVQTTPVTELDEETVDKAAGFEGEITQIPLITQQLRSTERNFMSTHALEEVERPQRQVTITICPYPSG